MASPCVLIHTLVLSSLITIICTVHARSEALEPDDSLFNLFKLELSKAGESWDDIESRGNDVNEAHHRVRRANVAAIRHLYDEDRVNPYSQDEKDAILDKHREYRKEAGASNMNYMVWSEELAYTAGLWASVCYWGHGTTNVTTNYTDTGQNLWLGGGKPTGVNAVIAWHKNEINNYIYDEATCKKGKVCGHYTQVVWAKTSKVGCARAYCAKTIDSKGQPDGRTNNFIFACHYSPGGNYKGVKPFKQGPACTECFSGKAECYDNYACRPCSDHNEACDCRQVCYNCGTVTADCGCECTAGWYGGSCSEPCEDTHDNCYKGWPGPAYCNSHPAIPKGCPLMCSVCEPEGDEECVMTTLPTDSRTPTKGSTSTTSSETTTGIEKTSQTLPTTSVTISTPTGSTSTTSSETTTGIEKTSQTLPTTSVTISTPTGSTSTTSSETTTGIEKTSQTLPTTSVTISTPTGSTSTTSSETTTGIEKTSQTLPTTSVTISTPTGSTSTTSSETTTGIEKTSQTLPTTSVTISTPTGPSNSSTTSSNLETSHTPSNKLTSSHTMSVSEATAAQTTSTYSASGKTLPSSELATSVAKSTWPSHSSTTSGNLETSHAPSNKLTSSHTMSVSEATTEQTTTSTYSASGKTLPSSELATSVVKSTYISSTTTQPVSSSAKILVSPTVAAATGSTLMKCARTCKNKGTLQNDCTCDCLDVYTGKSCERLIKEVESGVEIIFTANITHYTDEFEMQLRETVASLVTVYCNDNFQSCCINDQGKKSGTFAFVTYNDVQTARGYPTADGTKEESFVTMVIVKVPSTTDLCANGTQSTSNRRKRDLQQILERDRRAATVGAFFDQTKLLEVIKDNVDTIATNLNITVDSIKAGEVTEATSNGKKPGSGANPGVVAGVVVVVLLAIVIIIIIAICVVKRQNSLKNKTEDKDAWADKNDDATADQKGCGETINSNGQGM